MFCTFQSAYLQGDGIDAPAGTLGIDFLDHFAWSTPAMLFALTHWQKHLGDDETKCSAGILFDFIISKALKTDVKVVVLNDEWRAGVVGTDGLAVKVYNGAIESAEPLVGRFPCIKSALGRNDNRNELLADEDKPGKGHGMQTY